MRYRLSILVALAVTTFLVTAQAQTTTFNVTNSGATAYVINGASNPVLTLNRGVTYTFNINTPGHPFWIKTVQGAGTANPYDSGVQVVGSPTPGNTGLQVGTLMFQVPSNAPATLWYQCSAHNGMSNQLLIPAAVPATGPIAAMVLAALTLLGGFALLRKRARA